MVWVWFVVGYLACGVAAYPLVRIQRRRMSPWGPWTVGDRVACMALCLSGPLALAYGGLHTLLDWFDASSWMDREAKW
jgi:hypothetical protein